MTGQAIQHIGYIYYASSLLLGAKDQSWLFVAHDVK